MNGVRAVFFDAVGTLLLPDPPAANVYAAVAQKYGFDADAVRIASRFHAAFSQEEEFDRANNWETSEAREIARWQAIVAATLPGSPAECFHELYGHFARPDSWRVQDRAASCMAELLHRGLALGLASNFDSRLETVVSGFAELAPLAGRILVSSRVGVRKPGRGFFEAVVRAAGCASGQVLFVGDDIENDFSGAGNAGLRAVLFDPDQRRPDVRPRVTALEQLPELLEAS